MVPHLRSWRLLSICVVLAAGCSGSDRPATVPVSGTVTLNGQPVADAQVSFMTDGAPRAAFGTTDAEGKFRLTTFEENDGAMVGKHTVTISNAAAVGGEGMSPEDPSAAYGEAMQAAASGTPASGGEGGIPVKYANPKTSGLEREVTQGGPNEFDFEL